MRNKRGLSGVVVSLILVLLSIVAVGIVWVVVSSLLSNYSDKIEMGISAVSLKVISNEISEIDNKAIIKIKRGIGDGNVSGVSVMFETADGETFSVDQDIIINEQETKNLKLDLPNEILQIGDQGEYNYITSFTVYPKIKFKGKDTLGSAGAEATRNIPENLLENPGFEEWSSNCHRYSGLTTSPPCPVGWASWSSTQDSVATKDNSPEPFPGEYLLSITNDNSAFDISQTVDEPLTDGKEYILSSWVSCPSGEVAKMTVSTDTMGNDPENDIICDNELHYVVLRWIAEAGTTGNKVIPIILTSGDNTNTETIRADQAAVYEPIVF